MSVKSKLIYSFLMVFTALTLSVVVIFAWFIITEKTEPIIISTGTLRSSCSLYYWDDDNYDGILEEDEYIEILEAGIIFNNAIPGQVYHYKLVVENIGTIDGLLTISIGDILATNNDMYNGFAVSFIEPEENSITFEEGDIVLFSDYFLEKGETYEFLFMIIIKDTISSSLKAESMIVTNFIVDLAQEQL